MVCFWCMCPCWTISVAGPCFYCTPLYAKKHSSLHSSTARELGHNGGARRPPMLLYRPHFIQIIKRCARDLLNNLRSPFLKSQNRHQNEIGLSLISAALEVGHSLLEEGGDALLHVAREPRAPSQLVQLLHRQGMHKGSTRGGEGASRQGVMVRAAWGQGAWGGGGEGRAAGSLGLLLCGLLPRLEEIGRERARLREGGQLLLE